MRLRLRVARAPTDYDYFTPMTTTVGRGIFQRPEHENGTGKADRDLLGSDCNRGNLYPNRRLDTVSDGPTYAGTACLGGCAWSASRFLRDRRLRSNEKRPPHVWIPPRRSGIFRFP